MQDENTTENCQLSCAVHTIAAGSCKITIVNPHSSGTTSATKSKIHFKIVDSDTNKHFEISGTNASNDDVTFSADFAGIQLQTDNAINDQVIILPHLDTNQTAWTNIKWGTTHQLEWETAIETDSSIANMCFWAGLKLSNVPTYATNDDQAYFLYSTNSTGGGTLANYSNLFFVYSIGGTDYVTDLGIAVEASKMYKLRISIDGNRQVAVYVNGVQYGLTTTDSTTGTTQSNSNILSKALTIDQYLIPYVGVQSLSTNEGKITLCYEKISRVL